MFGQLRGNTLAQSCLFFEVNVAVLDCASAPVRCCWKRVLSDEDEYELKNKYKGIEMASAFERDRQGAQTQFFLYTHTRRQTYICKK